MDELIGKTVGKALSSTVPLLDLFFPGVQNKLMDKRMNNAVRTVELIKSRLAEYGLKIDYQKYFSEQLQIPLEWARAVSETEGEDKQELLCSLFTRHLTGRYDDDSHYVMYISMIKEMSSEDIRVLMSINSGQDEDYPAGAVERLFRLGVINIYHEITVPKTDGEAPAEIDGGNAGSEPSGITWGMKLGEQKAVQAGAPYMTQFGREFLEACTNPLQ